MGLSRQEQETVIAWNQAEDEMTVYTANPSLIAKLDTQDAYRERRAYRQNGEVVAKEYVADRRLVTIRGKRRTMSDAQRAEARKRMARVNANRLSEQS